MSKSKVLKINYNGFDHTAVDKQFGGDLTFVNDFCILDEYAPVSVYRAANPDTSKGHKKYMLLQLHKGQGMVRGMDEEAMEQWRYQEAVHCLTCDYVVYSTTRHDMAPCGCTDSEFVVAIDGGRDYTKISFGRQACYELGQLDLLTDEFKL